MMDTQEQAKIVAVGKKPNVRFAECDPEPSQIQPILDKLQNVLQTVLENQNSKPEVKTGETTPPVLVGPRRTILIRPTRSQVIGQIRPKLQTIAQIMKTRDVRTKETIHLDRVETTIKILNRTETGNPVWWIASTRNHSKTRGRAHWLAC